MAKEGYFDIEQIAPAVWKIYENFEASMYLVCGSERAALIDSAYGFRDIGAVVRSLTDLPVFVINTHGHGDHVFGNRFFGEAYMNSADLPLYEGTVYEFGELIHNEEFLRENADKAEPAALAATVFPKAEELRDGDVIDLGGKKLEAIAVPGHTAGSIALLDREDGFLFSGDAVIEHCWMFLEESLEPAVYLDALRRLRPIVAEAGVTKIYNGHYAWKPMEPAILDELIAGLGNVVAGTAAGKPYTPPFEMPWGCVEYEFGSCSVICRA